MVAPLEATPVVVQAGALDVSGNLAATGSDKALPASVDVAVADAVDGVVDFETTEQEKTDDEEVDATGGEPVVATAAAVPDAVPDVIDTATDQLAAISAPVSRMDAEESTPSVSVDVPAAENEVSATLDDVQSEAEPVAPEEEPGPDRGASTSDGLVGEEGAAVPAAVEDIETGAGDALRVSTELADVGVEQAVEGLVGDDVAAAEVDTASPAGDDTAGSSEDAGSAEAVATALSSLVEDQAAASPVEDACANEVGAVCPRRDKSLRNRVMRSCPSCLGHWDARKVKTRQWKTRKQVALP